MNASSQKKKSILVVHPFESCDSKHGLEEFGLPSFFQYIYGYNNNVLSTSHSSRTKDIKTNMDHTDSSLSFWLSNRSRWRDWLPFLGSVVCMATIGLVYGLTWQAGHLPPGARTPPISLLGCNAPEHGVYQGGFFLTGLVLLLSIQQWRRVFLPPLTTFGSKTAALAVVGAYLAVMGVAGQGVVTLEENILDRLKLGYGLSRQSIIHQQLAGIFFLGAATHCYATAYYIWSTAFSKAAKYNDPKLTSQETNFETAGPISTKEKDKKEKIAVVESSTTRPPPASCGGCCYGPWSVRIKLLCVVTSLLSWPLAEGLHPTRTSQVDKRNLNIAGLAQYIAVASYTIFFGSYTLDFVGIQSTETLQREKKQDLSKLS